MFKNGIEDMKTPFAVPVTPDWEGLVGSIMRQGHAGRVHAIELFLDREISDAICARYDLLPDLDPSDAFFEEKREIRVQSFLGYDYVRCGLSDFAMPLSYHQAPDTATLQRPGGRSFIDEHRGPITTWAEFESYPWPDASSVSTRALEWYEANLPDGMCIVGSGGFAHFAEYVVWLMGYETLCIALFEQRDLVAAISEKLIAMYKVFLRQILAFDRVKLVWGSDDMGFRGGTLISPADLREFVLPGHKAMASMAHAAGRPYLLHSCGNLGLIMDDLIDDVGIDAKHSFEDTIEQVTDVKGTYGQRIALLGGIDVDFLCRSDEAAVRARVRKTLEVCMRGSGYCLGTGNSVANYIPLDNYLAMLDEGRRFGV